MADQAGTPRLVLRWSDTLTVFEVRGPAGTDGAFASAEISEGEICDDENRTIGAAAIYVGASGTPGVGLVATDLDGDRTKAVTQPCVVGSVEAYDGHGEDAVTLDASGLTAHRKGA